MGWCEKGYGFVVPDNGGPDVFLHQNVILDGQPLAAGTPVIFDLQFEEKRKKFLATSCCTATWDPGQMAQMQAQSASAGGQAQSADALQGASAGYGALEDAGAMRPGP